MSEQAPRPKFFDMPTGGSGFGWHEIEPYLRCPKLYQFLRVRGIITTRPFTRDYFSTGGLLHAARAQWLYDNREGDLWRQAIKLHYEAMKREDNVPPSPAVLTEAQRHFEGFANWWATRAHTKPLALEYKVGPKPLDPGLPVRSARYDSIECYPAVSGAWLGELKSTVNSAERLAADYAHHGQILLQLALWGEEESDRFGELQGVLVYPLLKATPTRKASGAEPIKLRLADLKPNVERFKLELAHHLREAAKLDWNSPAPRTYQCKAGGSCEYLALCLEGQSAMVQYKFENGRGLHSFKFTKDKKVLPWE